MADIVKCECGGTYSPAEHEYCPSCFRVTPEKIDYSGCPLPKKVPEKLDIPHPKAKPETQSVAKKEDCKPPPTKSKPEIKPPAQKPRKKQEASSLHVEHKCDPLVEQQGQVVSFVHGLSEKELNRICTGITLGFEQKTDWHYVDDHSKIRVCIKTLGDVAVVNSLLPRFEYQCACGMPLSVGPCKVCGKDG